MIVLETFWNTIMAKNTKTTKKDDKAEEKVANKKVVAKKTAKKTSPAKTKKAEPKAAAVKKTKTDKTAKAKKVTKTPAKTTKASSKKAVKDTKKEPKKKVAKKGKKLATDGAALLDAVVNQAEIDAAAEKEKKKAEKKRQIAEVSLSKNDTMKVYMQDIGQISLVTKEEEVELAARIHGDDPVEHDKARAILIQANLRLVVKIAHDFKGLGLPLLDLISEGNIGLMRAVEKFDPAKGAKFSSYAAWWIKQSMRRALANQSRTIRIPVQSAGKINKIKSARMKLTEKFDREPTDAEIAEFLEFSERTVTGLKLADLRTFSLHDPIQQGEDGEFQDIIPDQGALTPDRILGDTESIARLRYLLKDLDEREIMILRMRFGMDGSRPKTLEEVSQEIGRTRERVRQIQNQALSKLRAMLADESGFVHD